MTGHRALEKKQITQGNNRKVQNPSGSPRNSSSCLIKMTAFLFLYAINSVIKRKIVSLYKKKRKDENNNSIF